MTANIQKKNAVASCSGWHVAQKMRIFSENISVLLFDLYMLHNPDSPHGYPYIGISAGYHRIVNICEEHIHILDTADTLFFETDYLPTYRSFELDTSLLDKLVNTYTYQQEYNIITRFNEEKHITLTYHSPTNEGPKDYDIFTGYPEKRAQQLVEDVYPIMDEVRLMVYGS